MEHEEAVFTGDAGTDGSIIIVLNVDSWKELPASETNAYQDGRFLGRCQPRRLVTVNAASVEPSLGRHNEKQGQLTNTLG